MTTTSTRRPGAWLPVLGWVALLSGVMASMVLLGRGALAGPPLLVPGDWAAWAASRGAAAASVAVVRLVVLAVTGWLLAVTLVSLLLGAVRPGRLSDLVDLLSVPVVRRVVHGALGVGLAGATAAGVAGLGAAPAPVAPATVAVVPPVPTTAPEPVIDAQVTTTSTSTTVPVPPAVPAPVVEPPPTSEPAPAPRTWTVASGDHLWSIAEHVMHEALGRRVDDGEVASYWRQLVAANRDRLADPANPDLLFAGDLLVVPDPPVPSAR